MLPVIIVAGLVVLVAIVLVGMYNTLVAGRNRYKNAFAQIDVQLKRRYDLIPNLVEVAKGYMAHEAGTLEAVIKARNSAISAGTAAMASPGEAGAMRALSGAEGALAGVLTKFLALSESYPDLKANTTMAQLTEELTSTENRVAFARQAYNDEVMAYNTNREKFPTVLFASSFGFTAAAPLESTTSEVERQAPQVAFNR
jgi:LemA protein